jgi:hypothetical protein
MTFYEGLVTFSKASLERLPGRDLPARNPSHVPSLARACRH